MLDIPNKLCLLFLPVKYFFNHFLPFFNLPLNIFSIRKHNLLLTEAHHAHHINSIRFLEYFEKLKHNLNIEPNSIQAFD